MPERTATMVPGYRHVPGNHCGSTALRNLLAVLDAEERLWPASAADA